ncbi:MAG: fdnI [Frankiales bacterium]|nr:fdnI [Frankiales bacterium]
MTWTASSATRTDAMMSPPVDSAAQRRPRIEPVQVRRFARAERLVHRLTAVLMTSCILTAAVLYNGTLSVAVGHRRVVELIHVYSGFALPAPMIVGLASAAYRADLGRLNRFSRDDWRWLRSRDRRLGLIPVGKFNAGQKINAWLSAGSILVLLGTGLLMYYPYLVRLSWRTGATFVHDWFALGVGLLVLGHVFKASRDAEARRGMRTGLVLAAWAKINHDRWLAELDGDAESVRDPDGRGDRDGGGGERDPA